MPFPAIIASVIIPVITDFIKTAAPAASRKLFGESVDDQIKIANADIERLKALAALDTPGGTPSQWVIDLRGSFRYIAATVLILAGCTMAWYAVVYKDPILFTAAVDLAGAPFGFIFGERLVLSYRPGKK